MNIKPGFWNCCQAKPSKVVAFDGENGELIWHFACAGCASTVHSSRVLDAPNALVGKLPANDGKGISAAYVQGEVLYFSPSVERMPHGTTIPAGLVIVAEVVDHGDSDPMRPRWTYVVRQLNMPVNSAQKQGAGEAELHQCTSGREFIH